MRPLETQARKEARKKRNQVILGIFISLIMLLSVVGYAFLSSYSEELQDQAKYKEYTFKKTLDSWQTKVNVGARQIDLITFYLPSEVENISAEDSLLLSNFIDKTIYIVANNLSERQAATSLAINLEKIVFRMQGACSSEEQETEYCIENNLPIKSCDDATLDTTIIMIEEDETLQEASINYKNGCLVIKGNGSEIIKAAEKAIFMIYGII